MDFYPHHIGDFKAATEHLSNDELVCYLRLIWMYYDKEQPLADDQRWLCRKTRSSAATVKDILREFFHLDKGQEPPVWRHGRIDGELAKYQDKLEKARLAGKASARARRSKRPTDVERTLNGRITDGQPANSQEPLRSNDVERKSKTAARFVPPTLEEVAAYFKEEKLNGDPAHFFDHFENCDWRLSGGRGKKMKNWRLSAKNWSRNQAVFNPKGTLHLDSPKPKPLTVPRSNDVEAWIQFARMKGFPEPKPGEEFPQYRGRVQAAVEKHNADRGLT